MTGKDHDARPPRPAAPPRDDRLKAALKANVARRKAQAKLRGRGGGDRDGETPGDGERGRGDG